MSIPAKPYRSFVREENLQHILRGQLILELFHAMKQQKNPFQLGESLYITGSSIPHILSFSYNKAYPHYRPPGDMDLNIWNPRYESYKYRFRYDTICKQIVQDASASLHAEADKQLHEDLFTIKKRYTQDDIRHILTSGHYASVLSQFTQIEFPALPEFMDAVAEVHFSPFSTGLLPPKSFDDEHEITPGMLPIKRDNLGNTLALKLSRLAIVPKHHSSKTDAPEEADFIDDLVDVYNIVHTLKLVGRKDLDPNLLRVLFLGFSATIFTDMKKDVTRFSPSDEHVLYFRNEFVKRYNIHIPPREMRDILTCTDELFGLLFPERSAQNTMPLYKEEKGFLHQTDAPDSGETQSNIRTDLLKTRYPEVFAQYPELERSFKTHSFIVHKVACNQESYRGF